MIYEKIKELCKEKGISVYRLEKDAGFTKNSIYKWNKCSPSVHNLKAVADVLGVKVDDLL